MKKSFRLENIRGTGNAACSLLHCGMGYEQRLMQQDCQYQIWIWCYIFKQKYNKKGMNIEFLLGWMRLLFWYFS